MSLLGKDLTAIRSHLGYTIHDIQHSTKIPLNTLESIENGAIFEQNQEIKTYVRSFVRSYGRAIKIDEEKLVKALDQHEAGNYNHFLLEEYPELVAITPGIKKPESVKTDPSDHKSEPEKPADPLHKKTEQTQDNFSKEESPKEEFKSETETSTPSSHKEKTSEPESQQKTEKKSDGVKPVIEKKSEKQQFKPVPSPGVRNVDWSDMGKKFANEKKRTPVWIIVIAIIALLGLTAYILYINDVFTADNLPGGSEISPEESAINGMQEDGLNLTISDNAPDLAEQPGEEVILDETLMITVYAANDNLEAVRIWSDTKPRFDPYWIERGVALNFEFEDTIRIRGQYERMLLFKNGNLIENFRQQNYNEEEAYVELTRSQFKLDQKWANNVSLQLPQNVSPPDSISDRPVF